MQFLKPNMNHIDEVRECLSEYKYMGSEFTTGNLILWSKVYNTEYAINNHFIYFRTINNHEVYYTFPVGRGNLKEGFDYLLNYCLDNRIKFQLYSVSRDVYEKINQWYPGKYKFIDDRNNADYIYSYEKLASLEGKKLHGKRNHINRFKVDNPDWEYETMSTDIADECIEMVKKWCELNGCNEDNTKANEFELVVEAINNQDKLGFIGGVIRVLGQIIALTIGEPINKDTFVIHFEKAFANVQGAYPMINQQFVVNELSEYKYINREEDMGIPGLRKAKLSYYPDIIYEKGFVITI